MKTRTAIFVTLCLLASVALTGCAGIVREVLNPRQYAAGTYSGVYQTRDGAQNGIATITVEKDGDIRGTGRNNTLGADFTIQALLSNTGSIRGSIVTNGNSDPLSGRLDYADGQLTGDLSQTLDNGSRLVLDFNLRKQ